MSFSQDSDPQSFTEARRQHEDEDLKESAAGFCQRIIDEAPIGIFLSTYGGRFLSANTAMAHMFGYSSPTKLIQGVSDIAAQIYMDSEQRAALLRRVSESHTFLREEVQYRRRDGSLLVANLYARAVRDDTNKVRYLEGFLEDVTDRKLVEHALQRSEQQYRELVENANSIILRWSRDGIITFLNEFGLRFFGFEEHEILGHSTMGTIVPETETTGRDLHVMITNILANPREFEHNVNENMRRNGERVWIDWTNKIVLDDQGDVKEILSIGSDISERKRTEEALRQSEALFRSLAEHANAIIGILQGTKFVYVNPYFAQITGYSLRELVEMDISQMISPRDQAIVMERAGSRQAGVESLPSRYEISITIKDGRERYLDMAAALIEYQRKPAIIGIAYDITERKYSEEELRKYREHLEELVQERTTDLARANERLRDLDRLKSMFIASMSHELRTPLNSIIGFTGMTIQGLSGALNDEQEDNLQRVYQSAKHLLSLISDVIDISKIEAGRIDTFPTTFPLRALIDEAVQSIQPQAQEKGLPVIVELPPEDIELHIDRKRLLQCLLNLLSNAVKFTETGRIAVTARSIGNELELSVTDTGIGIAEEDIPKLFEAFERLETHLRVKAGGTGLGLYLTKKIAADILHGRVSVQSQVGLGSTFTLQIPLEGERDENGVSDRG